MNFLVLLAASVFSQAEVPANHLEVKMFCDEPLEVGLFKEGGTEVEIIFSSNDYWRIKS